LRFVQPVYVGSDGSILWNKSLITDATLRDYVAKMSAMDPYPQVVLEVAPAAACQRVAAVRKIIDAAPFCHGPHSLCREGSNWKQWPVAE
jgi:biopolymer transport protein ExbD